MSEKASVTTSTNSGLETGTDGVACPKPGCGCKTGHKPRPSADALTRYTCGSCSANFSVTAEHGASEFFSVALDE